MRYTYLKNTTWNYARNYPKDVRAFLGKYKLKQSLKTSDAKVAHDRATQVNARYEETVRRVRTGLTAAVETEDWAREVRSTISDLDLSAITFEQRQLRVQPVWELSKVYLHHKAKTMTPGGYKAVRYSLGLFVSEYGKRTINRINREDGRAFLSNIAKLSASVGKSSRYYKASLAELLSAAAFRSDMITVTTQRRIWDQVCGFIDWAVYEGHLKLNPFKTVRFDQKSRKNPYAVLTDAEVRSFLIRDSGSYSRLFRLCLMTGMRLGEAHGLLRSDLIQKGNLGTFIRLRPNELRGLKTEAAERVIPLHPVAEEVLRACPEGERLFPGVTSNMVTKWFRKTTEAQGIYRPGLVFHSTRKWFITQCERQGVPEHFTASLVGHASARSGNGITYAIYSSGISDEQKRQIIDQLRLPA